MSGSVHGRRSPARSFEGTLRQDHGRSPSGVVLRVARIPGCAARRPGSHRQRCRSSRSSCSRWHARWPILAVPILAAQGFADGLRGPGRRRDLARGDGAPGRAPGPGRPTRGFAGVGEGNASEAAFAKQRTVTASTTSNDAAGNGSARISRDEGCVRRLCELTACGRERRGDRLASPTASPTCSTAETAVAALAAPQVEGAPAGPRFGEPKTTSFSSRRGGRASRRRPPSRRSVCLGDLRLCLGPGCGASYPGTLGRRG